MARFLVNEEQAAETNAPRKGHHSHTTKLLSLFTTICFVSVSTLPATFVSPQTSFDKSIAHLSVVNQHFDGTLNYLHPLTFTTKNSSNDTYTLKDMLKQDDVHNFMETMTVEIDAHQSRDHWTPILRSSLPPGVKTIMSIWSFKRKRLPDGSILK